MQVAARVDVTHHPEEGRELVVESAVLLGYLLLMLVDRRSRDCHTALC